MNASLLAPLLFLAGDLTVIALLLHFMPTWTRSDIVFSVTVDPTFRTTETGRRIVQRYRIWLWIHTAAALAIAVAALRSQRPALFPVGVLYQIGGGFAAFLGARRRTLPHAVPTTTLRSAELAPRTDRFPGGLPAQFGPFALLGGAAAVLAARWSAIPERFPVHWNIEFQPDRWVMRSPQAVFGPLAVGVLVCCAVGVMAYAAFRLIPRTRLQPPLAAGEARYRRAVAIVLLASEYVVAAAFAWGALMPLRAELRSPGWVIIGGPLLGLAVVVLAVVGLVRARRASSGTSPETFAGGSAPAGDRTPDSCWKAGVFYFNPADPAIFLEKRFGLGYTLNFANLWSWVIMVAVLLVPLVASVLLLR